MWRVIWYKCLLYCDKKVKKRKANRWEYIKIRVKSNEYIYISKNVNISDKIISILFFSTAGNIIAANVYHENFIKKDYTNELNRASELSSCLISILAVHIAILGFIREYLCTILEIICVILINTNHLLWYL